MPCLNAIDKLTRECATKTQVELPAQAQPHSPPRAGLAGQLEDGSLWALLDRHAGAQQHVDQHNRHCYSGGS